MKTKDEIKTRIINEIMDIDKAIEKSRELFFRQSLYCYDESTVNLIAERENRRNSLGRLLNEIDRLYPVAVACAERDANPRYREI